MKINGEGLDEQFIEDRFKFIFLNAQQDIVLNHHTLTDFTYGQNS